MHRKSLSHILEPSFRLYFIFLAAFTLATAVTGDWGLAIVEGVLVLLLFLYFRRSSSLRRKEILGYIENITCNMDVAAKDRALAKAWWTPTWSP